MTVKSVAGRSHPLANQTMQKSGNVRVGGGRGVAHAYIYIYIYALKCVHIYMYI